MIRVLASLVLATVALVATALPQHRVASSAVTLIDDATPAHQVTLPVETVTELASVTEAAGRTLLGARRSKNRKRKARKSGRENRGVRRRRASGRGSNSGSAGNGSGSKPKQERRPVLATFVEEDADEDGPGADTGTRGDIAGADNVDDDFDEEQGDEDEDGEDGDGEPEQVIDDFLDEDDAGGGSDAAAGSDGDASGGAGFKVGTTMGGKMQAHGTHFEGMGTPFGGCGVPPSKAKDDNGKPLPFVALNTNSEFANGKNCGRWVEITMGKNCVGGSNSASSICNGGDWMADSNTGGKLYGYVMDSCADANFWCKEDTYHLDVSKPYLDSLGLSGNPFNGRELAWSYMNGVPPGWKMSEPKFMWKDGSKWMGNTFWATLIVYNTPNGIGKVEQQIGGSWVQVENLVHLGNMFVMKRPSGDKVMVKVYDISGSPYGEYDVAWSCGSSPCSTSEDATSSPM